MAKLPEAFTPPPADGATGDVMMQADSRIWRLVQASVHRTADRLSNDRDQREELIQAARLELWRIDASRCDFTDPRELSYLRGILSKEMSNVAEANFRGRNARTDVVPPELAKALKG